MSTDAITPQVASGIPAIAQATAAVVHITTVSSPLRTTLGTAVDSGADTFVSRLAAAQQLNPLAAPPIDSSAQTAPTHFNLNSGVPDVSETITLTRSGNEASAVSGLASGSKPFAPCSTTPAQATSATDNISVAEVPESYNATVPKSSPRRAPAPSADTDLRSAPPQTAAGTSPVTTPLPLSVTTSWLVEGTQTPPLLEQSNARPAGAETPAVTPVTQPFVLDDPSPLTTTGLRDGTFGSRASAEDGREVPQITANARVGDPAILSVSPPPRAALTALPATKRVSIIGPVGARPDDGIAGPELIIAAQPAGQFSSLAAASRDREKPPATWPIQIFVSPGFATRTGPTKPIAEATLAEDTNGRVPPDAGTAGSVAASDPKSNVREAANLPVQTPAHQVATALIPILRTPPVTSSASSGGTDGRALPTSGPTTLIRLSPVTLGTVTVSITRDMTGEITVAIAVARPDALALLSEDRQTLHQVIAASAASANPLASASHAVTHLHLSLDTTLSGPAASQAPSNFGSPSFGSASGQTSSGFSQENRTSTRAARVGSQTNDTAGEPSDSSRPAPRVFASLGLDITA